MADKYSLRMKRISLAIADTSFAFGMFIPASALVSCMGPPQFFCLATARRVHYGHFSLLCLGVSRLRNHLEQNVSNTNAPPYLYPSGFASCLYLKSSGILVEPYRIQGRVE
ncbi:hypothetical protein NPIL_72041 [Nephila pilipes]|uniref:Uncharacterized protein n=1 Tax=Nephila pilipes TaxID=299642 RepID=A0A8X6TIT0_NEPPI|nr:hypothetical protein NPIL_72041 [Nephila pilipes]